jgi:hypothetical protein
LKIPARRDGTTLREPAGSPFHAEPRHDNDRLDYNTYKAQFTKNYLADAEYLRDLIIERLPSQLADALRSQNGTGETSLAIKSLPALLTRARWLPIGRVLAKALCTKK